MASEIEYDLRYTFAMPKLVLLAATLELLKNLQKRIYRSACKKREVIETDGARPKGKRGFEKREVLRNIRWNVVVKQSKLNEVVVKVIFIVKYTQ